MFPWNSKKARFQVLLVIHDLSNIPYVSGQYFAKYKLKSGGSAKGQTQKYVLLKYTFSTL